MCGRFALTHTPEQVRAMFGYANHPNFPPRYNVAPTQPVGIVRQEGGRRRFMLVRWGLLPAWVKDPGEFPRIINARGETVAEKPAFRASIRHRRCLVPADAFYEWRRENGGRRAPFMIRRRDRALMAFAAIWETYAAPDGGEIDTMAIVTTTASGTLASLHDRMPVILGETAFGPWLDVTSTRLEEALALVRPAPDDLLEVIAVGPAVNKAVTDDPSVQAPAIRDGDSHGDSPRPAGVPISPRGRRLALPEQASLFAFDD
ncbi:SOS response-associated peptidase [Chelatococcus sp. SYSU_G07232]|uniref:Abasic site processing protein n=1 Tax=Chelatococcus albus TaxID=3047466 RepID=A0ABT7AEJ1_9HYPH|nr:SOS response-associated peptidase [Chelatococcus sp. SYSU_G07232]MDJ1157787.1 SOS response-associated peptidase [Chelatococcus sp. SYSU_G07232]